MERTRMLALSTVFMALYLSVGLTLQSIAFGAIQVRVADALYPLIAVFGFPALTGTFLGHLVFNLYGFCSGLALGLGDLASPFIFLLPKLAIWKLGGRSLELLMTTVLLHVAFVAFWVAWLLASVFGLPFWGSVLTVGLGEVVAEVGVGIPLATAVKRRFR